MSPQVMIDDFKRLMQIAQSDLLVADTLLKAGIPEIRQEEICLHCHAALEKALKGVAFLMGFEPPHTHRLAILSQHIVKNGGAPRLPKDFDVSNFVFLDAYSSVARYENLLPKAENEVAKMAYEKVKEVWNEIERVNLLPNADY